MYPIDCGGIAGGIPCGTKPTGPKNSPGPGLGGGGGFAPKTLFSVCAFWLAFLRRNQSAANTPKQMTTAAADPTTTPAMAPPESDLLFDPPPLSDCRAASELVPDIEVVAAVVEVDEAVDEIDDLLLVISAD